MTFPIEIVNPDDIKPPYGKKEQPAAVAGPPITGSMKHQFKPRGAAKRLLECRDPQILLSGPAGTGKSRATLEKVNLLMLLNPGAKALIVRKTLRSLASSGLRTWEEKVIQEATLAGIVKYFGGSAREPAQYRYSNGSVVIIGGLDDPDKIMSTEYDIIYVQEATDLTEDDWEKCTSRLRNGVISFQQLIADCNPSVPFHWLKKRCDRGDTLMLYSKHEDNPVYFDEIVNEDGSVEHKLTEAGEAYIEGVLAKLSGVRRMRLYEGKWAAAEGLVYEDFNPELHIVDEMPKGWETWKRSWAIDFGYRNPFVCQFWATDPDGGEWLYREIYMTGRIVEDHARQIMSLVRKPMPGVRNPDPDSEAGWVWTEPKPSTIVCDWDAEDRATLERHIGIGTVAAEKAVKTGVENCQTRFRLDDRGKPKIYFLRDAVVERDQELADKNYPTSTLEELPGYCWPDDVKTKQASSSREAPVKENDHGMDAMRYRMMEADFSGAPQIRWV